MSERSTPNLEKSLSSQSEDEIIAGLRRLSTMTELAPNKAIINRCIELFKHPDPEVRSAAIFAIALHWGAPESLRALEALVLSEQDSEVSIIAIRSIARVIVDAPRPLSALVLDKLKSLLLDEEQDPDARGLAYKCLRISAGLLGRGEYSRLDDDITNINVDWNWVRSI